MGLSGITGGATSVGLGSLFKASTTLPGSGLFSQVLQGAQSTATPAAATPTTATPSIVVPPGASDPTASTLNFGALPGGNLLRAGPNGFSAARIEQLRQQTLAAKQTFLKLMNQKLREAGIDPSVAINLQTDSQGNVAVTNDHPDKAMIEALFGEDPDLQQSLEQLSKSATALRDAQQPQAAATGDQTLNLTLRGTDVEIAFA